jgi:hypothetical protein
MVIGWAILCCNSSAKENKKKIIKLRLKKNATQPMRNVVKFKLTFFSMKKSFHAFKKKKKKKTKQSEQASLRWSFLTSVAFFLSIQFLVQLRDKKYIYIHTFIYLTIMQNATVHFQHVSMNWVSERERKNIHTYSALKGRALSLASDQFLHTHKCKIIKWSMNKSIRHVASVKMLHVSVNKFTEKLSLAR